MRRSIHEDQEQVIVEKYLQGGSLESVGVQFGCSAGSVRNLLRRLDIARRPPGLRPNPIGLTKVCSSCQQELLRAKFYREGHRTSECRKCVLAKAQDRYARDEEFRQRKLLTAACSQKTERSRATRRWRHSGWSAEQFELAWQQQAGCCAICSISMAKVGRSSDSVCADHDHTTSKTRALLCRKCNAHLGIFERRQVDFAEYLARF